MKKITFIFLFLIYIACTAQTPTWSGNVACLMYTHCTKCHNTNGIAPFPLLTYNDAVKYATPILNDIAARRMPPWPPDVNYVEHAHKRTLTPKEIDVIANWVSGGTPHGTATPPATPSYPGGGSIANPDLVAKIPSFNVNTTGDLYRCFVIPSGISVSKFITEFEVIPGNRSVVHHVQVFQDTTNYPAQLDANDPGPGYTSFGGTGSIYSTLIGTWVPGSQSNILPAGMGIKLRANANIILQVHYPGGISGQTDQSRVEMRLSSSNTLRDVSIAAVLEYGFTMTDGPLVIPANTVKTFHSKFLVAGDYTVLGILPHMHLVGKSIKAYGIKPNGDTIRLIDIPQWKFHWQGEYQFRKPVFLPSGTTLWAEATYDNTVNNPDNPNDPPKQVTAGENTTDEMMLVYFSYLPYKTGDENIVIDNSTGPDYYDNCSILTGDAPAISSEGSSFEIYPNPAFHIVVSEWQVTKPGHVKMEMTDIMGRRVKTIIDTKMPKGKYQVTIDVSTLENGIYFITLQQGNTIVTKKIVKN